MASTSPFQPQFFYGSIKVPTTPNIRNYLANAKDTATSCRISRKCYENVFTIPVPGHTTQHRLLFQTWHCPRLSEPAPAGATLVGHPTALRLFSHPAALHPGMASRRTRPASCMQSERLLWWDVGVWNTILALGGNGEASCGSWCSVHTILADCPSLNHHQYLYTATGHCHRTRGSTKYCGPGTICSNLSSAIVPTNV